MKQMTSWISSKTSAPKAFVGLLTMLLTLCALSVSLTACAGASKLEMQETSSALDVLVEVRYMQEDSIGLFVGNTLYLNTKHFVNGNLFPLALSKRDPMDIERIAPTETVQSPEEFTTFIQKTVPMVSQAGIVMGGNVKEQIGFSEQETIDVLLPLLRGLGAEKLFLFHEENGEYTSMKKL